MQKENHTITHYLTIYMQQALSSVKQLLAGQPVTRSDAPAIDRCDQDTSDQRPPARLGPAHRFSQELFAELLLELPAQRRRLTETYGSKDYHALRHTVHQLLGAVSYCDTPDFEYSLRELQLAIQSDEAVLIDRQFAHTLSALDTLMVLSGININRID